MPVYDCRKDGREPGAKSFPCNVKILDACTGERIPNVFYLATDPPQVGRFVVGPDGAPLTDASKKTKRVVEENGRRRVVFDYARLERWERRPWVAVAVDNGQMIDRSKEESS